MWSPELGEVAVLFVYTDSNWKCPVRFSEERCGHFHLECLIVHHKMNLLIILFSNYESKKFFCGSILSNFASPVHFLSDRYLEHSQYIPCAPSSPGYSLHVDHGVVRMSPFWDCIQHSWFSLWPPRDNKVSKITLTTGAYAGIHEDFHGGEPTFVYNLALCKAYKM